MVTRSSGVEAAALQTLNQLSSFLVQQIFVALIFPSAVFTVAFLRRPIHSGVSMSGHEHHHHHVPAADSGSMGGDDMDMGMPMFFVNTIHTTLWFRSWETKDLTSYILSLVGLVAFAICHEGLACYRAWYLCKLQGKGSQLEEALIPGAPPTGRHTYQRGVPMSERLWLSFLYAANLATSYLLMLAVMTFNVGYFFAVIIGLGLGYFVLFDRLALSAAVRSDSCHVRLVADE